MTIILNGSSFSPRNGEIILKPHNITLTHLHLLFQSPQWGNNSKEALLYPSAHTKTFQSPQWGNNSKAVGFCVLNWDASFSPRNGEIILKVDFKFVQFREVCFSPRNGEIILKGTP